jgi:hypothetical protein
VVSCSHNRQIILWKVEAQADAGYSCFEIAKVDSRNSIDLAISSTKLALLGSQGLMIVADFDQAKNENCLAENN